MKKIIFFLMLFAGSVFLTTAISDRWSPAPGSGMGQVISEAAASDPEDLTTPDNREWVAKLRKALTLEQLSKAQFTADAEKFNVSMPYRIVVPQKEDHIQAILDLLSSYGRSTDGAPDPVVKTKTTAQAQAYRLGIKMEQDLTTLYEWLIRNAENRNSAAALNKILIQTRKHLVLFEHALRVGRGMGNEMGPGGMVRP